MAKAKRPTTTDQEIDAISTVLRALDGLDGESIQRVLDYVFSRLSIGGHRHAKTAIGVVSSPAAQQIESPHRKARVSIRDLKEEKHPESSNQMAALVAYYLSELAGEDERKEAVNTADLERYFKQAGFKLPKALPQTLPHATAAGYFDSIGSGLYKLNAVGYNLVVHGLPRSSKPVNRPIKRAKKKTRPTSRRS